MVDTLRQLHTFHNRSARVFYEYANVQSESSRLVEGTLQLLLTALSSDGFNPQRIPEERREDDLFLYMSHRAVNVRNADTHVTDQPEHVLGDAFIQVPVNPGPDLLGKRDVMNPVEDGDAVSETGSGMSSVESDDIPPLEPIGSEEEENPLSSNSAPRIHPIIIYGDVAEEMRHLTLKNRYSRSNALSASCQMCARSHSLGHSGYD